LVSDLNNVPGGKKNPNHDSPKKCKLIGTDSIDYKFTFLMNATENVSHDTIP